MDVLVSTDALARGIDIGEIDFVISYDCPKFIKTYIHRVGRTARAGRLGTAITLLQKSDEKIFHSMMAEAGKEGLFEKGVEFLGDLKLDRNGYEEAVEKSKNILSQEREREKLSKGRVTKKLRK